MTLFIGNATRQIYDFTYRVPEQNSIRSQKIVPGTQQQISGHLTAADIDHILAQHSQYGLVCEKDIDRSREFSGLCYSVGKPITAARLTYLLQQNLDALIIQGREIRQANAIAQNTNIGMALTESGRPERVSALDLTIQQERQDPNNSVPQFSEGMLVTRNPGHVTPRGGRGQRRKVA